MSGGKESLKGDMERGGGGKEWSRGDMEGGYVCIWEYVEEKGE